MPEKLRAEAAKCTLEVTFSRPSEALLSLAYEFHNGSAQAAFVFNQVFRDVDDSNVFLVDAQRVYVELAAPGVVVSKKVVPVPRGLRVEKPFVPCATRVKPGEKLAESLFLALPLRPWTHYLMLADKDFAEKPAQAKLLFELGFFLATVEGEALGKTVKTSVGEAVHFYPFPASSQRLLRVGPFSEAVPVRVPRQ